MSDTQFSDPKLVSIYNTVNPIDNYKDFYLDLAKKTAPELILDIGCGTGLLSNELAKNGFKVIGIEPSSEMLKVAQKSEYSQKITWVEGDALHLEKYNADLALMTGHVAQFYTADDVWLTALKSINNALKKGGFIAFESRNPGSQPWPENQNKAHIDWPSETTRRKVIDPVAGEVQWWITIQEVKNNLMRYKVHYYFQKDGEELVSENVLKFRTQEEITKSLNEAGFKLEVVYGDWEGNEVTPESTEFIFIAKKS